MKARLRKATPNPEQSFSIHKDVGYNMLSAWHYHPECELLLLKRSCGTCLIGDHVGPFKNGDIFLFGSNLPHTFRHERKYMERQDDKGGESVVVLFQQDMWGEHFSNLPEISSIVKLLNIGKLGLRITGETRRKVAKMMDEMMEVSSTKRLIYLLSVLEMIADTKDYELVSSNGFKQEVSPVDHSRISKIFEYTFNNFNKKISLEEVAGIINMGRHSFCRYFKFKTRKTYIEFLMEVRIGNAKRLLVEGEMSISEIGYTCGYNNLSHFYHQFKSLTLRNPLDYKQHYLKQDNN